MFRIGNPCSSCLSAAVYRMLWDFHKWRNDQRPGTVHATYLVYGTRKQAREQDGDVEMTDSPPENGHPFSDNVPARTLTLVKEETLQGMYRSQLAKPAAHLTYGRSKMCWGSMRRCPPFMSTAWHHTRSKTPTF